MDDSPDLSIWIDPVNLSVMILITQILPFLLTDEVDCSGYATQSAVFRDGF